MFSELILASTSPARRVLMDSLKVPYRAEAPGVDEDFPAILAPAEAVTLLAERKARAVWNRFPEALVIGSDQLAIAAGQALGKPVDRAAARDQLQRLSGAEHSLATGLCVVGPGFFACELDLARLHFFSLAPDELERYLDLEEWRGCAGGYRVEAAGQALLERLDGDRTGVQGLPMLRLVRLLRSAGLRFFA